MIPPLQEKAHHSPSVSSKPGRESVHVGEKEEPKRKPKKVNSELRKQQNRMASRNYREKRKQKLHHLQRLIKDESTEHQRSSDSPEQSEAYVAPVTTDHATAGPSPLSYQSTLGDDYRSENSSSIAFSNSTMSPRPMAFSSPLYSSTQSNPTFEPNWNAPRYSPPPPPDTQWNMPPYSPGLDQDPRVMQYVDAYDFPPPPNHTLLDSSDQIHQHPQPLQYSLDPSLAAFDPCSISWDLHTQSSGTSNVSHWPTSSSSLYYELDERLRWPN